MVIWVILDIYLVANGFLQYGGMENMMQNEFMIYTLVCELAKRVKQKLAVLGNGALLRQSRSLAKTCRIGQKY